MRCCAWGAATSRLAGKPFGPSRGREVEFELRGEARRSMSLLLSPSTSHGYGHVCRLPGARFELPMSVFPFCRKENRQTVNQAVSTVDFAIYSGWWSFLHCSALFRADLSHTESRKQRAATGRGLRHCECFLLFLRFAPSSFEWAGFRMIVAQLCSVTSRSISSSRRTSLSVDLQQ